jgi:hypothetical protein
MDAGAPHRLPMAAFAVRASSLHLGTGGMGFTRRHERQAAMCVSSTTNRKQAGSLKLWSESMSTIAFPIKRTDAGAHTPPPLDLPGPRIWTLKHLADFLGVSVSWVYKRTASDAEDPIPRVQGVGRLRFDTQAPAFQAWLRRQGVGSDYVDSGGGDE